MIKLVLITVILLSSFTSQGQLLEDKQSILLHESLTLNNYSIRYPSTWEVDTSGLMGSEFYLFSMLSSAKDKFRENINLMTEDLSEVDISLNQYVEISQQQIEKFITKSKLLESKRIRNDELQFHRQVYQGRQGDFNLTFEQFYWIVDKKAYVLTFTCESKEFKNFKIVGEQILNSFKFEY